MTWTRSLRGRANSEARSSPSRKMRRGCDSPSLPTRLARPSPPASSWRRTARRSLAGRPVALASSGEALELPCVHAGQPIRAVRGRWADPRVAGNAGVTQGVHVGPILVDPCAYLNSSADGPGAGDEDIDAAPRALQ